jgi:hypothetical protein
MPVPAFAALQRLSLQRLAEVERMSWSQANNAIVLFVGVEDYKKRGCGVIAESDFQHQSISLLDLR